MQLTILERLMLLSVLPKEGDFLTIKIIRTLRESLSFDEQELKEYGIKQEKGVFTWTDKDYEKGVTIGEKATDIIVDTLRTLDKDKKLTDQLFTLYEKFMGD